MAEQSGFFPDVSGDRTYTADFLARWVASIISNGVYNGDLAVAAGSNMQIKVPSGKAWINGYYYRNDGDMMLAIANADGVLNRRDTVVLRWDVNARSITVQVLQGTAASSPVAPAITRTADQYDLKLAEISIPAGTTAITQALITDTRLDKAVCGIVTGVVQQADTTALYNQIQNDLANFKCGSEADFSTWSNLQKASFNTWLDGLKNVLDGDTAGNLLNLINSHKADENVHVTQLVCATSGTVHTLAGLSATTGVVACIFKADAAFTAGDSFTIGGTAYTVKTTDGTTLTAGAFAAGAWVEIKVDVDNKVIYISPSAPVGSVPTTRTVNGHALSTNFSLTCSDIGAIPTSASCNKNWNWSGQSGQPSWIWGGNDATNMYVYDPSKFVVYLAAYAHYSSHAVGLSDFGLRGNYISSVAPSGGNSGDTWDYTGS